MHKLDSLYLDYLLKLKIAELFGFLPVNIKNNINSIPFKNIITNTKNHKNNLIGKVVCQNFMFYYIPLHLIDQYEQNNIGIPICHHINVCPFCFGIQLDNEEQLKLYKLINKDSDELNNMTILIKDKFCFDMVL
jgi:hypothetical protein